MLSLYFLLFTLSLADLIPKKCNKDLCFGWSNNEFCNVNVTQKFLSAAIQSESYLEQKFYLVVPDSYCNVQACINLNGNLTIICQEKHSGELVMLSSTNPRQFLKKRGIFAKYDYLNQNSFAIYDGAFITIYTLKKFYNKIQLLENWRIKFNQDITDLLIANSEIFVIHKNNVYILDKNGDKQFQWIEETGKFTSFLFKSEHEANSSILIYLFVGAECLVLLFVVYFLKLRIYKTNSGRIFIEPNEIYKPTIV